MIHHLVNVLLSLITINYSSCVYITCINFLINTINTYLTLEAVAFYLFFCFRKLSRQFQLHSASWEPDLDKDEEYSRCLKFDTIFHAPHFPQIIIYLTALASSRALSLTPLPLLIYSHSYSWGLAYSEY